jgi:transcriptional regulator with PAS, ATPase and Fis domain
VLRWLGYAWKWKGDLPQALVCFHDALASARRCDDGEALAQAAKAVGTVLEQQGRYREATEAFRSALDAAESQGQLRVVGLCHLQLGIAQLRLGNWDASSEHFARCLAVCRALADKEMTAYRALAVCRLRRRQGDPADARKLALEAGELARELQQPRVSVLSLEALGDIRWEAGDREAAFDYYEHAMEIAQAHAPSGDLVYELGWRMGDCHLAAGRIDAAHAAAMASVELAASQSDRREEANSLLVLASVLFRRGDLEGSRSRLEQAISTFRAIETPYELARAHRRAARLVARDNGRTALEVVTHLFEARRLLERLGATKDLEQVEREIATAEARVREREPETVRRSAPMSPTKTLITESPELRDLVALARDLGHVDLPVLLEGETGTGKEVLARVMHESGWRSDCPFVAVNCAAFPKHLLESELFGHRKGSFTGADRDHKGVLQSAEEGTVLLDEIDKASRDFQSKLLRVIEERALRPVGSTDSVPLKARICCASNRPLRDLVAQGEFLPDLYYRMAAFELRIPALRDRPEDIIPLARHFLRELVGSLARTELALSEPVESALLAYEWPGNVRELKNVIESAAFLARHHGTIEVRHLPRGFQSADVAGRGGTLPELIEGLERRQIRAALRKAKGVKTDAAKALGVSRKGLSDRLRRLGLE